MSATAAPITNNPTQTQNSIPAETVLEKRPPSIFASGLALREGNSKKPIYQIHKWWARRLGSVFRNILIGATIPSTNRKKLGENLFYKKHDVSGLTVLDPFVGGGTTLVEAAKCNANVIGVDIDPVACFVTGKELQSVDELALQAGFAHITAECKDKLLSWYKTKLPDGKLGTVVYAFWVDLIPCPSCKRVSDGHPHYQLLRNRYRPTQVVFCSSCGEVAQVSGRARTLVCKVCQHETKITRGPISKGKFTCPSCNHIATVSSIASTGRRLKQRMFALEVLPDGDTKTTFKKAEEADLELFEKARRAWRLRRRTDRFVPKDSIPVRNRSDQRPIKYGYKKYRDLFNDRQLLCLSTIAESIAHVPDMNTREFLATAFSDSLAANNMFCFYAFDYQKLTPLFGLHAYHKVNRPVENNVWGAAVGRGSFSKCFNKLIRAKRYASDPFEYRYNGRSAEPQQVRTGESIKTVLLDEVPRERSSSPFGLLLNQSSEKLAKLKDKSVDLILSDPPYYDNIAYSELSDFYHVWLKRLHLKTYRGNAQTRTPLREALYVKDSGNSEHDKFVLGLKTILGECNRVLKDNGLFVFTFHHRNWKAWSALGSALQSAGFNITALFPVRSEGRSQFHSSKGNLKWDAVFCCRKRPSLSKVGNFSANRALRHAAFATRKWKQKFRTAKLRFGTSDQESLRSAYYVKALVNNGLDPGGVGTPVFPKIRRRKLKKQTKL